jgi:hypothetical protein
MKRSWPTLRKPIRIVAFCKQLENKQRRIMEIMECEILPDGTSRFRPLFRYHHYRKPHGGWANSSSPGHHAGATRSRRACQGGCSKTGCPAIRSSGILSREVRRQSRDAGSSDCLRRHDHRRFFLLLGISPMSFTGANLFRFLTRRNRNLSATRSTRPRRAKRVLSSARRLHGGAVHPQGHRPEKTIFPCFARHPCCSLPWAGICAILIE